MPAIPLRGDRSAWNAANYQTLHTNDINDSASAIHHTLGTSASQAALGNHTHTTTTFSSGSSLSGQLFTSLGSGSTTWASLTNHSHSASAAGDGGKLYWDNIWLDSVHDHSGSPQGGKFEATNLSSGAAVLGYVLSADGSGSTVWSLPSSSISNLNDVSDVHTPAPNEGDVLTWSAASGSWIAYPAIDWRVTLTQDETGDDSDKTFTVPTITEWQILWVWVEYTSSSTEGVRQLEIQLQDSGSNVIAQFQTGVTQGKELTYKYLFGIGVPDLVTPRDGNNVTTPLPAGTFLSEGQKIRVWDNNGIDTSGDDMIVRLQYASRAFRIPEYYIIPIHNSIHPQISDSVALIKTMWLLMVNNATQLQNSSNIVLTWRIGTLSGMDSTHTQTSGNITTTYRDSLLINNCVHSHVSDNITSTQYNVLTIHNTTLRLTSNKVTLAINVIHNPETIGENSSHLQTSENTILTATLPFLVDNSSQTQATNNFGLVTDILVLGVRNSVQPQTSNKVSVNYKYILGIRNPVQLQTSNKIVGFTWHQKQLTINNSRQNITSNKVTLQNIMRGYYVSTTGNNSNPGTPSQPWRTIAYGIANISAGDTLYIRGGTYQEKLTVTKSGTAQNYITVRNYPNETPIINGTGISFTSGGLLYIYNSHYFILDGLEVINADHAGIMVHTCGYVDVYNCTTNMSHSSGIGVWWSDHIRVSNNKVINGHILSESEGGSNESLTMAGTTNFEIDNNEVYMDNEFAHFGNLAIDCKDGARFGTVHHNYVHDYDDDESAGGIYLDAWDSLTGDIDVYNNYVKNSVVGIQLGSEAGGTLENVRVWNNMVYNVGSTGIGIPQRPAPYDYGIRRNIEIYNNTIYKARFNGGAGIYITSKDISNIVIRNNIVYFNNWNGEIVAGDISLLDHISCDHNLVYGSKYCAGDYPDCVELSDNPTGYPNIYGNITDNPDFTSITTPDFHLLDGSPAINAGVTISLVSNDYDDVVRPQGAAYDIGALEHI